MDINKAWKKFEKTGDIMDYLEFCKYKKTEETKFGQEPKSKWNNNSGK